MNQLQFDVKHTDVSLKAIFIIMSWLIFYGYSSAQILDTINLQTVIITDISEKLPLIKEINNSDKSIFLQHDGGAILKNIEGFSGIRRGGSNIDPVYRGLKNNQLNYIVDGIAKIEGGCPNRMDPALSHIEPEELKGIQVYRGSPALEYFASTHGIILMKTMQPLFSEDFKLYGTGGSSYESNTNGQKQYLHIGTSSKKLYTKAFGIYKKYGNYQDGNFRTIASSFAKYSYSGQLAYKINEKIIFEGLYRESYSNDVMFPALPMDEDKDDTRMMYGRIYCNSNHTVWKNSTISFYHTSVFHQMSNRFRDNYRNPQMPMRAVTKVDALNYGAQWKNEFQFIQKNINVKLLLEWENIEKSGERDMLMIMNMPGMPYTETRKISNLWNNAKIQNASVFAAIDKKINRWKINFYCRTSRSYSQSADTLKIIKADFNYFNSTPNNHFAVDAGIMVMCEINSKITNIFNIVKGSRFPDMNERYIKLLPVGFDQFDYLGNPQLKPETSYQAENSIAFQPNKNSELQLNLFATQINNFIHSKMLPPVIVKPQSMNVAGVKQFYNAATALFFGGEISLKKNINNVIATNLQLQYVYANITKTPKILFSGKQAIGDTILINDPLPEIPPFEAKLELEIQCTKKLTCALHTRYIAPQNKVSQAFYETKNSDFTLFNCYTNYSINQQISLYIACHNIFNTAYYEHLNRRIIGSTQKLYEPGRNFIIGLQCKF